MIAGPRFLRVEGFLKGGSRYYREVVRREWNLGTLIEVHIGTTSGSRLVVSRLGPRTYRAISLSAACGWASLLYHVRVILGIMENRMETTILYCIRVILEIMEKEMEITPNPKA